MKYDAELLSTLERAAQMVKTANRYFPKSVRNSDKFSLLVTGVALDKAIETLKAQPTTQESAQ